MDYVLGFDVVTELESSNGTGRAVEGFIVGPLVVGRLVGGNVGKVSEIIISIYQGKVSRVMCTDGSCMTPPP